MMQPRLTTDRHTPPAGPWALEAALRTYWGFREFLPLQEQAMQAALHDQDSVVVLPTGGGKSLCYQAPAVCRDGVAIVVSPLISLMKDQVEGLRQCGVRAACLHSMMPSEERNHVLDDLRRGCLKLLYVAPERLVRSSTLRMLAAVNVSMVAVDEAHCISAWGHDFRPEYRALNVLKQALDGVAVHGYTATATQRVRQDIASQLGLVDPKILVGTFDRPNLVYRVRPRVALLDQIRDVLQRHQGESGIIYCITRKEVDATCDALTKLGYRAAPYHAGLPDDVRHRHQDQFINDQIDTIVATVAFGMGIDKSNVRYVIHAGMPKSLEHYQQESGRAGRDGLEAECVLYYSQQDFMTWRRMIEASDSSAVEGGLANLASMAHYCCQVDCRHRHIAAYFGQSLEKDSCGACDVCLQEIELVHEPLIVGQKILSCVVRLREQFGGAYTASVLCGSRDHRILHRGHDRLSTWGILGHESKRAVRDWIEQLVSQQYLVKSGDYNVLKVTDAGWKLLRGDAVPRLSKPAPAGRARRPPQRDAWQGVDRGLFDALRRLRQSKAAEKASPAYVVFSDASLREMARTRPSTLAALHRIKGVGQKKLADFGQEFVRRIVDYCHDQQLEMDIFDNSH